MEKLKKIMNGIVFLGLLTFELLVLAYIAISHYFPKFRIWPPQKNMPIRNYFLMFLTYGFFFGVLYLCFLEANSNYLKIAGLNISGMTLLILGLCLYIWCRIHFSKKLEFGFTGKLVTSGPYRYIRNPIYVADVLISLGIAFLANSLYLYLVLVIFSIMILIVPIIEEPWLVKQYGANYISYFEKVPRFVPSFHPK